MSDPNRLSRRAVTPCALAAAALLVTLAASPTAAQTAPPPPAPAQPSPRETPGLVNEIQKLLTNPSALLPRFSGSDEPRSEPDAPAPSKPQAEQPPPPPPAPVSLPPPPPPPSPPAKPMVPSMVSGHQSCPATPGGGGDCQAAAEALCKAKGYSTGKSLGVDATEKCSAKVLIPGRTREPGDCRTENFVTRAWCQ
jgi:hypothetical protein